MTESVSDRVHLAQKIVAVKQRVAQAISDEFFSTIPNGPRATECVAGNSARTTRASIWISWPEPLKRVRPKRLQITRAGRNAC